MKKFPGGKENEISLPISLSQLYPTQPLSGVGEVTNDCDIIYLS